MALSSKLQFHQSVKLGKKKAVKDERTLKLGKYLKDAPPPPASEDWRGGQTSWGMFLNDNLGDCVIAADGHGDQIWTLNLGQEYTVTNDIIQDYYEVWGGYVPGDPATDQGMDEITNLNLWRKFGFGPRVDKMGMHKLLAYADPLPTNWTHVKQAISLFGFVYIGLQLPLTAQGQSVWDVVGDPNTNPNAAPGSWGGHAVVVPAYDSNSFSCITWGENMVITNAFWNAYVDEVHALLSPDWINASGISASGFDLETLMADLADVTD